MTLQDLSATAPAEWGESRARTVTWYDPAIGAGEGLAMAGLDYLQAMIEGVLPPLPSRGWSTGRSSPPSLAASSSPASPTSRRTTRLARCTEAWSARCSTRRPAAPSTKTEDTAN